MVDSFSFRFDTRDCVIVISGDTTPTQALIDHGKNCDILVHEAYSMESFGKASPQWQEYRRGADTSSVELAHIANMVKPGLLVIYHRSNAGGASANSDSEDVLLDEIRQTYKGKVVAGRDLDVF